LFANPVQSLKGLQFFRFDRYWVQAGIAIRQDECISIRRVGLGSADVGFDILGMQ
jgi:hypothetical protein